jgi:hypothetical protein
MAIDTVVGAFEDNSERILWLPSITLAYLFTLSGDRFHFVMAIASIGGAQWFRLLVDSDFASVRNLRSAVVWFMENFHFLKTMPLAVLSIFYATSVIYAPIKLYQYFTHQDLVLVGLGATWCGIAIVVLVNIAAAGSSKSG